MASEYAHHYADSVLAHYPSIRSEIQQAIASLDEVSLGHTSAGRFGLKTDGPDGFNMRLRRGIVQSGDWRSEVGWTDTFGHGLWLFDPDDRFRPGIQVEEKFDLALVDEHMNARRIWNVLANQARLDSGQKLLLKRLAPTRLSAHWRTDGCSCLLESVRKAMDRNDWPAPVASGHWVPNSFRQLTESTALLPLLQVPDKPPTVVGEIQLGNWALAYRDVGRILAVRQKFPESPITLFVVIVTSGCLQRLISAGTVNFDRVRRTLARVGNDLTVPTWLVGIDFVHDGRATHPRS